MPAYTRTHRPIGERRSHAVAVAFEVHEASGRDALDVLDVARLAAPIAMIRSDPGVPKRVQKGARDAMRRTEKILGGTASTAFAGAPCKGLRPSPFRKEGLRLGWVDSSLSGLTVPCIGLAGSIGICDRPLRTVHIIGVLKLHRDGLAAGHLHLP